MLLTQSPIGRFKRTIDSFWMTNFQAWKDLQGDRLEVTDEWEPQEVVQIPVYAVPQVTVKPQAGIRQKTAEKHNIRLHQILWPQQGAAQGDGWARRFTTRCNQALREGHIHLDPIVQDKIQGMAAPPAILSGIPLSRIQVAGGKASELTTGKGVAFYREQAEDFTALPAHQFGRDEQIVEEKMWTALRCAAVQPKYADVWWKLLHNKLPLRTRAQHFKGNEDTSATCPLCGVYDQTTSHFLLQCDRAYSCWKEAERLLKRMDTAITLRLEVEEVVNLFPTTNTGSRLLPILKSIFGAVVYANWIAYTQCEYDGKLHSTESVIRLMHGMIGKQIRNEFAAAKAHMGEVAFVKKWCGNPGLAKVIEDNLVLNLLNQTST